MVAGSASTDLRRVYIKSRVMVEVQAVFSQDAVCQGALALITKLLFARGAQVEVPGLSGKAGLPKPLFRYYVRKYFTAFLLQAFNHMLCFGFAVWTVVKRKPKERLFQGREILVPIVVEPDMYTIYIVTQKNFDIGYEIYSNRQGIVDKPDPKLSILFFEGHEPNSQNGNLRGPLSSIVNHSKEMAQMFEWMIRAEWQRTHPPYTLQSRKEASDQLEDVDVPAVSAAVLGENIEMETFRHNRALEGLERAKFVAAAQRPPTSHLRENVPLRQHMGSGAKPMHMTVEDNTMTIPPGLESCNQQPPMPEARSDLLSFEEQRQNHLMFLFGIPTSLGINATTRSFSKEQIGDNDFIVLTRTLKHYQKMLVDIGTEVLQQMYETVSPELAISLPLNPPTDLYTIFTLHEQDVISKDTRDTYLLEIAGFQASDKATEPNEHVRPPVRGSDSATTVLMKRKADALQADSKKVNAEARKMEAEAKKLEAEAEQLQDGAESKLEVKKINFELTRLDKQKELEELKFRHQAAMLRQKAKQPATTKK